MHMKNISMPFYIAVGLSGVAVISFFIQINTKIVAGLSIAALFFTIAQMIDSQINFWNEDMQKRYEVFTNLYNTDRRPENAVLATFFIKYMEPSKKQKVLKILSPIFYCIAFVLLFTGFVFPFNIDYKIESGITILSIALLFFSIWIVDKQHKSKEQWDEVMMAAMMNKAVNENSEIESKLENI